MAPVRGLTDSHHHHHHLLGINVRLLLHHRRLRDDVTVAAPLISRTRAERARAGPLGSSNQVARWRKSSESCRKTRPNTNTKESETRACPPAVSVRHLRCFRLRGLRGLLGAPAKPQQPQQPNIRHGQPHVWSNSMELNPFIHSSFI